MGKITTAIGLSIFLGSVCATFYLGSLHMKNNTEKLVQEIKTGKQKEILSNKQREEERYRHHLEKKEKEYTYNLEKLEEKCRASLSKIKIYCRQETDTLKGRICSLRLERGRTRYDHVVNFGKITLEEERILEAIVHTSTKPLYEKEEDDLYLSE